MENFARWLALWRESGEEGLGPEAAAMFQEKAARIVKSLQPGARFYRESGADILGPA